jgi:hypothetical protein
VEPAIIPFSNIVIQPDAVVIEFADTLVVDATMFRTCRPNNATGFTSAIWHVQNVVIGKYFCKFRNVVFGNHSWIREGSLEE